MPATKNKNETKLKRQNSSYVLLVNGNEKIIGKNMTNMIFDNVKCCKIMRHCIDASKALERLEAKLIINEYNCDEH